MRVRNFLTEPDRDIFIENKNVPYCRFSLNILKKKITGCVVTRMRVHNFLREPDRDILIEKKNVSYGRISPNTLKTLYRVRACAHARAQIFNRAR